MEQTPFQRHGGHFPWKTTVKCGQQVCWPLSLSYMAFLLILHLELCSSFQVRLHGFFLCPPAPPPPHPPGLLPVDGSFFPDLVPEDYVAQLTLDFCQSHIYFKT